MQKTKNYISSLQHQQNSITRASRDNCLNESGKRLLDLCKATNLRILNGRLFKDKGIGEYTRSENNGNSFVDYILSDVECYKKVSDFCIDKTKIESDHFPLQIKFDAKAPVEPCNETGEPTYKYVFDNDSLELLYEKLDDEELQPLLNLFYCHIQNLDDTNVVANAWMQYFIKSVEETHKKRVCKKNKFNFIPWVTEESVQLRSEIISENDPYRKVLLTKDYKRVKQKKQEKL